MTCNVYGCPAARFSWYRPVTGSVQAGPPGTPSTVILAYSGQPWPEPSLTTPLTLIFGTGVRAMFVVVVPPSVTVTPVTVADWKPYAAAVTS